MCPVAAISLTDDRESRQPKPIHGTRREQMRRTTVAHAVAQHRWKPGVERGEQVHTSFVEALDFECECTHGVEERAEPIGRNIVGGD